MERPVEETAEDEVDESAEAQAEHVGGDYFTVEARLEDGSVTISLNESSCAASMPIDTASGVPLLFYATHATNSFFGPELHVTGTEGRMVWSHQSAVERDEFQIVIAFIAVVIISLIYSRWNLKVEVEKLKISLAKKEAVITKMETAARTGAAGAAVARANASPGRQRPTVPPLPPGATR